MESVKHKFIGCGGFKESTYTSIIVRIYDHTRKDYFIGDHINTSTFGGKPDGIGFPLITYWGYDS